MSQGRNIHTIYPVVSKTFVIHNSKEKSVLQMIIFIQFSPNNCNDNLKQIFKIKFAYVTSDIAETSIKNDIYHYTTLCEIVICDRHLHFIPIEAILIF
jgi:hypothetical protein